MAVLVVLCALIAATVIAVWRPWPSSVAGNAVGVEAATAEVGPGGVALILGDVHITAPAGVAPSGTTLTAALVRQTPSGMAAELTTSGDGLSLDLEGLQPGKPLTLTMPAPQPPDSAAAAVLISHSSDTAETQLIPASYSPATGTITAEIAHLSPFWPAFIRFDDIGDFVRDFLGQTAGLTGKRPDCAGTPATTAAGDSIALGGDFSAKANPVVWPCLRVEGDKAIVTLTPNTPLPWRVRAAPDAILDPPGTVDVRNAVILSGYRTLVTHRPYAEGLLIPGVPMTYRFPTADLPGVVEGSADSGTYLGMALLFAFELALSVFGVDTKSIGDSVEALTCLGDAVEAADLSTSSAGSELADFARAVLNCAGTVLRAADGQLPGPVKVVLTILGSGIALVAAGIQGAVATITSTDRFTVPLEVKYAGGGERWDNPSLTLTANGLGAVRVGMSTDQARQAAGARTSGPQDSSCQLYGLGADATNPQAPWWRADTSGRIDLIITGGTLYGSRPAMDVHTKEGIRLGDPLSKVMSTYQGKANRYVDIYGTTVVIVDGGTGNSLRFDSLNGATVDNLTAGRNDVIRFDELCG